MQSVLNTSVAVALGHGGRGALASAVVASWRQGVQINGAGATFPYPIYSKWFSEYNKIKPDVQINYQSIGSGGGIRQLTNQTVFFGATDGADDGGADAGGARQDPAPADRARRRGARSTTCPRSKTELKFSGALLADIFLGKVTKWNDPAIAKTQCRRDAAGHRHHRRPPLRRLGHDATSGSTSSPRCRRSGSRRSASPRR